MAKKKTDKKPTSKAGEEQVIPFPAATSVKKGAARKAREKKDPKASGLDGATTVRPEPEAPATATSSAAPAPGEQDQVIPFQATTSEATETAKPATRKARQAKTSKMTALDAAAKVLQEAGKALNCQEMIGAMAVAGYWTSPGGKTPASTLYSAILRELKVKGEQSRFRKAAKGRFEATSVA